MLPTRSNVPRQSPTARRFLGSGLAALLLASGCGSDDWQGSSTNADAESFGQLEQSIVVGPQLTCLSGSSATCLVRNMPMLHQMSELVDIEMWDMRPFGCYDTSMSMVIQAAVANRTTTAPLAGRTLEYTDIVGGDNEAEGCSDPEESPDAACPTPKEYEKLSQSYWWAFYHQNPDEVPEGEGDVEPLHFPEVVNDFGGTKRRFPTGCNPDVYGNCAWNTAVGNGAVSLAARDFMQNTSHVSNEYLKSLMDKGMVVMLGFLRYRPVEEPAGSGNIVFKNTDANGNAYLPHKIAFAGHSALQYPLLINDAGNGLRRRVTVTSDMSKIATYAGIPWNEVSSFTFPNGKSRQTFMEYDPAHGDDGLVNFVEFVDFMSLSLPADATGKQVFSAQWSSGWTSLMPFTSNGAACQLAYNTNTGAVHFDQFFANSNGTNTVWSHTWGTGFTNFIPYYINGAPQFIAYNATNGEVHFDGFAANLQGPIIRAIRTWPAGLTSIVPFVMNGRTYLLMYDKNSGAVSFRRINTAGDNTSGVWESTWGTGFTHFVPYSINGEPHLIAYNKATGAIHYDRISPNLVGVEVKKIGNIGAGLELSTLPFAGPGYFFAYTSNGDVRTHRVQMDGGDSGEVWKKASLANATSITPFTQSGKDYMLMYDKASGAVRSYALTLF